MKMMKKTSNKIFAGILIFGAVMMIAALITLRAII